MRGEKRRHQVEELGSFDSWFNWNWLPAVHWREKLDFVTYIHVNDRRTGRCHYYISYKEFAYSITITAISAGAFGIGLGQLIIEIAKW